MNRFINFVMKADLFLLRRIFMPIAHWIDWRFHINQYDQGGAVLSAGLAMNFAASVQSLFGPAPWVGAFSCFASGGLILIYSEWLKRLTIASRKYEKQPDQISREQAFFMVFLMPPLRLVMVTVGTLLILPRPAESIVRILTNPWMAVMGCALYLAGGLPPTRKRKEKKVWAWRLLNLATTPTGP